MLLVVGTSAVRSVSEHLARLRWSGFSRRPWGAAVADLPEDDVLVVGRSQATEVDAMAPFGHLVLHMNRELIHHGAEICALQDLYRVGSVPAR